MKKASKNIICAALALCASLTLASCGSENIENTETTPATVAADEKEAVYTKITAEEAKNIMDTDEGYIILDVRTKEEYDGGHIPGAVLIPDGELEALAESELADKSQRILVYCRSGRRSAASAKLLVTLGYTDVLDFGGIIDWSYETVQS